jgi:hypothetical protein
MRAARSEADVRPSAVTCFLRPSSSSASARSQRSLVLVYPRIFSTDVNHVICKVEGVDRPGETERRHPGSHHAHGEGVRRRGSADDLIRLGEECRRKREA